jgi:hypothetical protein
MPKIHNKVHKDGKKKSTAKGGNTADCISGQPAKIVKIVK